MSTYRGVDSCHPHILVKGSGTTVIPVIITNWKY